MGSKSSGPGKSYRKGITIKQLFKLFPDGATTEAWFTATRWPDGIACPHCRSVRVAKAPTPQDHALPPLRLPEAVSTKTGTALEGSSVGFQNWMIAIYYLTTNLKGSPR